GFDFFGAVLDCYLGRRPDLKYSQNRSVGDLLLPAQSGKIKKISKEAELSNLPGVLSCRMRYREGDSVVFRRNSGFCSGIVHVEGEDSLQVVNRMQRVLDRFVLEVAH